MINICKKKYVMSHNRHRGGLFSVTGIDYVIDNTLKNIDY